MASLPRPDSEPLAAFNFRLPQKTKDRAARLAVERYHWPLTRLLREYLEWEMANKKGLFFTPKRPRRRSPK